ncbi:MAG: hypothetical protein KAI63_00380, partial [Planctomycetes bacterium]|nr:hypothetical protein [Planctomycetota bacterium]
MKKTWAQLLLLVLFALIVRVIIGLNTYVISSDAPLYIDVAQLYHQGHWRQALNHPYHPFYPFCMSLLYRIIGNWEWAGMLISMVLSSLAIIP